MDLEVVYSLIGIVGFILIIFFTLRAGGSKFDVKTKTKKKQEIIDEYKSKLEDALKDIAEDKKLRVERKTTLLKEYSSELSRNIFFDENEVREIVRELSTL